MTGRTAALALVVGGGIVGAVVWLESRAQPAATPPAASTSTSPPPVPPAGPVMVDQPPVLSRPIPPGAWPVRPG